MDATAWVRAHARPLSTLEPGGTDDDDLRPLLDAVGDARVVIIGESMHRLHELYAFRHRLFRFLAREAGFTALVMESGFVEARGVDRWIARGEGSLRELLRHGLTYHMGKCQEMLDQVVWMREEALAGRRARLHGMDLPDSASSARPAVQASVAALDVVDPAYAAVVRERLLPRFEYLPEDRSGLAWAAANLHAALVLDDADRVAMTAEIDALEARMRAMRPAYVAQGRIDEAELDAAIHAASLARHMNAFLAAMSAGATRTYPGANLRDRAMADTVLHLLESEERMLVVAANGHAQRSPLLAPPILAEPLVTLGQHLTAELGDDLVIIGSTYGGGEAWMHRPEPGAPLGQSRPSIETMPVPFPGTLDALMADAGIGDAFLDLRDVPADGAVAEAFAACAGTMHATETLLAPVLTAFDAVVHVDRISPWHTWIDADGRG
jgi:erythromycin esterase